MSSKTPSIAPEKALRLLKEGNRRFRTDLHPVSHEMEGDDRLAERSGSQAPFAAVLGCSDSRVPVEVVFGQGQGQLFVVRVAGNIVTPTQLGSLEFAVAELGVRLIVVLGHSGCKAVIATLEGLADEDSIDSTSHFVSITERISRAIVATQREHESEQPSQEEAVALNVRQSCEDLLHESTTLAERVRTRALSVVGGVYDLESGRVRLVNEPSTSVATASAILHHTAT